MAFANSNSKWFKDSTAVYSTVCPVSIGEEMKNERFHIVILNDPTSGIIYLISEDKISVVEIINLLGQKILSARIKSYNSVIDLRNRPKGVYLMQIETEKDWYKRKIVVN